MKKTKRILSILLSVMLVICATYVIPAQPAAAYSVKAEKLTLSTTTKELVKGQTITLTVSAVKPTNASKDVTWKTSDSSVATVNEKGVVKAKKAGEATITAVSKTNEKVKATCKITVLKIKIAKLRLEEVSGTFECGKELMQEKWKEIYPYWCKYIGIPEKITKKGMTVSWDDAVNSGNLVEFSAETNTVYVGPLPHHNNFDDFNHYDYEPFIMQVMHESAHLFNQQGTDIVSFSMGQWVWEASATVAESLLYADFYGEYNRISEDGFDLLDLLGPDAINGVLRHGNKYNRTIVDDAARSAFYYMATVLSTKGTYDYWRKVYNLRMEDYKKTGNNLLGWDDFSRMLDQAAGKKKIDGMSASEWLKSRAVSNNDGKTGNYLIVYSQRPIDERPVLNFAAWNRYIDDRGDKNEKALVGTKVNYKIETGAGKTIYTDAVTISDNGCAQVQNIDLSKANLKDYTALKVTAEAKINKKTVTVTNYHVYRKGRKNEGDTTVLILLDKNGNIVTNAKAADFKVSGASSVNKDTMSLGTVVIKGKPGTTYTIEYNNKTYKISQPECRRIYPITL